MYDLNLIELSCKLDTNRFFEENKIEYSMVHTAEDWSAQKEQERECLNNLPHA